MVNIYIGNLEWDFNTDKLIELFAKYGRVFRAQIIMDRETGQSRGFGFVEMPNEKEANEAIGKLSGSVLNGRSITVNAARPRTKTQR